MRNKKLGEMESFSVCTSVYKNDRPEYVRVALDSMLVNQSVKPAEIVLVQDGPVPDSLSSLLSEYENKYPEVMVSEMHCSWVLRLLNMTS